MWLCCQYPWLQGKRKGVLHWEPKFSWLLWWDGPDARNIAQQDLNLWSSADVLVNWAVNSQGFNICLPRNATGALRGPGYEAKWARKLPRAWTQSCTQGGRMTRELLNTHTLREVWSEGCFPAGGCSSEGTTVSKYQRKSKTRVTIWTLFKTQRHGGRGYAILFTLTHQQRLGLQQLNACTTGEDIRPDLRIKAIKKKVNLFLCSRLRRGKQ